MGASAVPPPPRREGSAALAAALAERLVTRLESPEAVATTERVEIPLGDVETTVDRFGAQYRLLQRMDESLPCLVTGLGVPVPIDLGVDPFPASFVESFLDFRGGPYLRYFPRDYGRDFFELTDERRLEFVPPYVAAGFFRERLAAFLTSRFEARGSDISEDPGIRVQVDTRSHGLRVHYSPAYFFNPSSVLGNPTTPVVRWIQPGRYVFGASVPGRQPRFEMHAEYDIPPSVTVYLDA